MSEERKIFESDEDGKSPGCQAYLESLGKDANPFACPYLRVLPTDMAVKKIRIRGRRQGMKKAR